MASAKAAEAEKAAAGENRAVEHVALHADAWTDALMFGAEEAAVEVEGGGGTPAPASKPRSRSRRSRVQ